MDQDDIKVLAEKSGKEAVKMSDNQFKYIVSRDLTFAGLQQKEMKGEIRVIRNELKDLKGLMIPTIQFKDFWINAFLTTSLVLLASVISIVATISLLEKKGRRK